MVTLKTALLQLDPAGKTPTKNPGDLCYDLYCIADDDFSHLTPNTKPFIELDPGESHIFHTGIAMAIPTSYGCCLWDRSGMGAKRNIHRLAGVIDSTYRGEWMVSLINLSKEIQVINAGDRIVQAQFVEQIDAEFVPVSSLVETNRGVSGFGSSGA